MHIIRKQPLSHHNPLHLNKIQTLKTKNTMRSSQPQTQKPVFFSFFNKEQGSKQIKKIKCRRDLALFRPTIKRDLRDLPHNTTINQKCIPHGCPQLLISLPLGVNVWLPFVNVEGSFLCTMLQEWIEPSTFKACKVQTSPNSRCWGFW